MRLVYDIETNGLFHNLTTIHCIRAFDIDEGVMYRFDEFNEPIFRGIKLLNDATTLIGHNIINFDNPALLKISKKFNLKLAQAKSIDTIIESKFLFTNLMATDKYVRELPSKLVGSHSLGAWGYRLGEYKGEYGKKIKGEEEEAYVARVWAKGSQEMYDYCEQDVMVNVKLYEALKTQKIKRGTPQRALDIEHQFATIISRQERQGVFLDVPKAIALEDVLRDEASKALDTLLDSYKPKWFTENPPEAQRTKFEYEGVEYPHVRISKTSRKKTITCPLTGKQLKTTNVLAGSCYTTISLETFNPNSGNHITRWLTEDYGWTPSEFTKGSKEKYPNEPTKWTPSTDGDTLETLTFDGVKELQHYQMITKRLGQLADGDNALLKKYTKESRIHGRCDTLGAVTRRCTHSTPNLAQVPANRAPFGEEFRDLFTVPEGYKMIGCDGKGLELRVLAHYLYSFDKGAYADVVLNGDIHTKNMNDAGLSSRDDAKTFIYAFLYGAGSMKLGEIVLPNGSAEEKEAEGKRLINKFTSSNPAIKFLLTDIKRLAKDRKYVLDIDGNKLFIRSVHSSPNLVFQSCGAILMKYWLVEVDRVLQERGYENTDDVRHTDRKHDYEFVLNIHDEAQVEGKEEISDTISKIMVEAFPTIGDMLNMNIAIEGDSKVGASWKYTH